MPKEPACRIEKILSPTDFSELSGYALDYALRIGEAFGALVHVIHIVPQTLMHPDLFPYLDEPVLPSPEIRERARERLEAFVSEKVRERASVETRIESGEPAHRILSRAESLPADLVVLGRHGFGGFRRWLLGAVADKVVRQASCSVLLTRHSPGDELFPRVLCAVDFSPSSLRGLACALRVAAAFRGALTVVYVAEPSAEHEGERRDDARHRKLNQVLPGKPPEGCSIDVVVAPQGTPHREIHRLVKERRSELVVVGARGRGVTEEKPLGSTADALMRTAPCPLWIAPDTDV